MSQSASAQWKAMAVSCVVGVLIGGTTANFAIIGKVSENGTLLVGLRRDVDRQYQAFQDEQKRTDERLTKQSGVVREFMALLKEQNLLMRQMLEQQRNKP